MITAQPGVRLSALLYGAVPLTLSLALVLLTMVPTGIPDLASVMPSLAMMSVYFWSIYRPHLLPAPAAFLVGLTYDALSGGPLGLMAVVLLLVHSLVVSQRRVFVGKSFFVAWWGFAMVAGGAFLLAWMLACLWMGTVLNPMSTVIQALLTIVLYPCLGLLFSRIHRQGLEEV